jgi:hypothetical protein
MDVQANTAEHIGLCAMYGFASDGSRAGATIVANGSLTVCMPVLGMLGLGSDKMIPLGGLNDDIRVEIGFESMINSVVCANGSTPWTITSIELELCIVELSDEGENIVRESTPYDRPIFLHTNSWRHYVSSFVGSLGSFATLVPARFASVKSLVLLPRRNTDAIQTRYTLSSRVNPNFATINYRIGASIVPSKFIVLENSNTTAGFAEAMAETYKAFHALNTSLMTGVLTSEMYNARDDELLLTPCAAAASVDPATTHANAFCLAIECESFSNRGDVLLSGLNTLSSQIFFESNNISACGVCQSYTLDFYANYDSILVLENGILSVRF